MWSLAKIKKNLDNKIKDLLFKNIRIRKFKSYVNLTIIPYFIKSFIALFLLIIFSFLFLKVFKEELLNKIYLESSDYLYSYLNLDDSEFSSIKIFGIQRAKEDEIRNLIKKVKEENKKDKDFLIEKIAKEIRNNQKWVNEINVYRTLPNNLNIKIIEYIPFALWQDEDKKFVIDRDGNKIKIENYENYENLIILSGKNANLNVKSLFNILSMSPEITSKVYSATWVGQRRWDIRFESGLLVKLPSSSIKESWQKLIEIYNQEGALYNLKIIDLRIDKKTYLEYKSKI